MAKKKPHVLVLHASPNDFRDDLESRFPQLPFTFVSSVNEVVPSLRRIEPEIVFSIRGDELPGPVHRTAAMFPSVKWLQVGGAGFDHLLPLDRRGLLVSNSAGILAPYLAESVMAGVLQINGNFLQYRRQQKDAVWCPQPFHSLEGKVIFIIGVGAVGGQVAKRARAFGMKIHGLRTVGQSHPDVETMFARNQLLEGVQTADVVSLHVALTEDTTDLINSVVFDRMKPGTILVNTSRGAVVNEEDMVEALRARKLRGAYLDVFRTEPLPPESPLWKLENVIITPHASDCVANSPQKLALFFAGNLKRWIYDGDIEKVVFRS